MSQRRCVRIISSPSGNGLRSHPSTESRNATTENSPGRKSLSLPTFSLGGGWAMLGGGSGVVGFMDGPGSS